MRLIGVSICLLVLSACVSTRPTLPRMPAPAALPMPWAERVAQLQKALSWQLDGRAAAAIGTQGWQASLNWRQRGDVAELRLAGPLGVGATSLTKTAAGISVNGAPPSEAVQAQLQDRLGFELPIDDLRYWLLGVPAPGTAFELTLNSQDRAERVSQSGWTIDFDGYRTVDGELLPDKLVMRRDGVRVRIAVDHWVGPS